MNGNDSFCLASRASGGLLKVSHIQANGWFSLFVGDGVLREIENGGTPDRPRSAARFQHVVD